MADATKEKGKNVYAKIANIQQDIHTVIKGGFNDHFKYKFARERDVIAEVKPLLGREGLVITHSLIKDEESEHGSSASGSKKYLTKLTIRFRITNVEDKDDFIEADAIGYGQDGEDKGAPKAYTMALKYFLSKMFLIETGDDAEEEGAKKGAKKGAAADQTPGEVFETAKKMIAGSRNIGGLIEYDEKIDGSKKFNAAQKKELHTLIKDRIGHLEAAQA